MQWGVSVGMDIPVAFRHDSFWVSDISSKIFIVFCEPPVVLSYTWVMVCPEVVNFNYCDIIFVVFSAPLRTVRKS